MLPIHTQTGATDVTSDDPQYLPANIWLDWQPEPADPDTLERGHCSLLRVFPPLLTGHECEVEYFVLPQARWISAECVRHAGVSYEELSFGASTEHFEQWLARRRQP